MVYMYMHVLCLSISIKLTATVPFAINSFCHQFSGFLSEINPQLHVLYMYFSFSALNNFLMTQLCITDWHLVGTMHIISLNSQYIYTYMLLFFSFRASWIKHEGVKYQKGGCVVLGVNNYMYPIMAIIIDVFVINGRMLLEVQLLLYQKLRV